MQIKIFAGMQRILYFEVGSTKEIKFIGKTILSIRSIQEVDLQLPDHVIAEFIHVHNR